MSTCKALMVVLDSENPVAFRHWTLSGPLLTRLLRQFEEEYLSRADPEYPRNFPNHEQGVATRRHFRSRLTASLKHSTELVIPSGRFSRISYTSQ